MKMINSNIIMHQTAAAQISSTARKDGRLRGFPPFEIHNTYQYDFNIIPHAFCTKLSPLLPPQFPPDIIVLITLFHDHTFSRMGGAGGG